jgi:signal transduction histidine kinase
MRKVALVFVLAVLAPSLVLAWLAVRSLRDQQFLLERQQSLLYQGVADTKAKGLQDALAEYQQSFTVAVNGLLRDRTPAETGPAFDELLRKEWQLADVGFVVKLSGGIVSPLPNARNEARTFLADNGRFLANREAADVYWNPKQAFVTNLFSNVQQLASAQLESNADTQKKMKAPQVRNVLPQQAVGVYQKTVPPDSQTQAFSKSTPAEAEFRQLIGEDQEGTLARFVDNKLNVLFWYRPSTDPQVVFGAQLSLPRLVEALKTLVERADQGLNEDICIALLDDKARPVAISHAGFQTVWKRPFVASEVGQALPHWEVAVYLLNPSKLTQSAATVKLTLGLLIGVLLLAIGVGSWLIVADLNRQLRLARQKTDFVSNVSHELKTPLTSIRMFSELLAEGRVNDPDRQRSYLAIITAETARLTRLINNVLDFARMERGENKYHFQKCDISALLRETVETFRPHLEANGFHLESEIPSTPLYVKGDRDALAQVVVNLLSNAEKYSNNRKEVRVTAASKPAPAPSVQVQVLDRGPGVPDGCDEKIFEQFYRAHDSLSSGIQGSGLGLTLARQIARAHGGDVVFERRDGGGSCFSLLLPLLGDSGKDGPPGERTPPGT